MRGENDGDLEIKSVGEISNQREQQTQDQRTAVQTRTFTRWMNVFLQRCDPPVAVHDLFTDVQDGRILMALLEQLSGCKMLYRFRSSPQHIFRLNNISTALAFLNDRHVRLLGIDASAVADGIPSVVLNLIWNIILHFQVKQVMGGLQRSESSRIASLSMSSYPSSTDLLPQPNYIGCYPCNTLPSDGRKAAREPKYHGKTIKTLLQWVQRCTSKFGVEVHDFGKSWRSGLAFLAVIKSVNPALVDLRESLSREPRENLQLAFMIAHQNLDIPPLLEPEDVSCASPEEQSIITYVSMFLGHSSGTAEDCTTHTEVPEIPNFGSLEPVSLGETLADDPKAEALLKGLEKSSEQLLWNKWARRPSQSPRATTPYTRGSAASNLSSKNVDIFSSSSGHTTSSPLIKNKSRSQSVVNPPSPLDATVVSQEIRSWMKRASADQKCNKPTSVDESHFSLSSEEGIYSLSALDSDEEGAYSHILDLNKEVFQPYAQLRRQASRVEEEEEMLLNEEQSNHLEIREMLSSSRCTHQEGSPAQNVDSEVRPQSAVHKKYDWNENKSPRELVNSTDVFDMEPEDENRKKCEAQRVVRGQSEDDGDYCGGKRKKEKTGNITSLTHGYGKTEVPIDQTRKTNLFEVDSFRKEPEEMNERLFEKYGRVSVRAEADGEEKEDNLTTSEEGKDERVNVKEDERGSQRNVGDSVREARGASAAAVTADVPAPQTKESTRDDEDEADCSCEVGSSVECKRRQSKTTDDPINATQKSDTNGGVDDHSGDVTRTPACSADAQQFREGGFILETLAASCDITPLELELLLVLWILLYCCFVLHHMIH